MLSFNNLTTFNKKKSFNKFSQGTFRHKSPKDKILSLNYSASSFSTQNKKLFNSNKLFIGNYNININNNNRLKIKSHIKGDKENSFSLNSLFNYEKLKLTESYTKSLMYLDTFDNKKIYNKKSQISNTDSNLNSFIKVNIKLNNLKGKGNEFKTKNNLVENKQILKKENNEYKLTDKKNIFNENKIYEINKILLIQKWWKNYYNQLIYIKKKIEIIKMQYFFDVIKRAIFKYIMKVIINKKYMKNPINTKKNKIQIESTYLIGKNNNKNINKNKEINYNSNTKNYKSNTYKHIKNKNIIDDKIIKNLTSKNNDINNYSYKGHKRDNIISFSSKLTPMLCSLQNSFEGDINNDLNSLKDSTKKIIFNKNRNIDNINKINNVITKPFYQNTILNINKYARFEKIKKLKNTTNKNFKKKYNMYNNTYNNKNKKKKVIQKDNLTQNKLSLNSYYNKNTNDQTLSKKYNIFLDDDDNYSQTNLSKIKNINTEPSINNNINNINDKKGNYDMKNSSTLNASKKKNKVNEDKFYKLRKFDTCPISCNNNKEKLYNNYYVKKYSSYWDKIKIKNKILYNFIEFSNQIKLRFLFYNRFIQIIFQTFKLLFMKIYFSKYKDIINRDIILNKLKLYLLKRKNTNTLLNENNNNFSCVTLQRGDIINNININNFINYTKDEINNLIPNIKDNYNLVSNSIKLNSNTHSYFKSTLPYLSINSINNVGKINIMKNNFDINNNYHKVYLNKKKEVLPKGILVDQINQLRMVFNLLEQHSSVNSDNISHLLNYFKKWNKICEIKLDNKTSDKISLNYKKINIQNKYKKNKQNYERIFNKNIISSNNVIKKADMEEDKYSKKTLNEINCNKYVKINQSKNIYKTRYSNTFRGSENSEILRNDNIKIRYIDNRNRIISDNISDLSNYKYNFNSEIIYQKKILNYNNQISNLNNDINYLHKSIISESKLNNYKNNNKIEEREFHFNSLSSNKNTTYTNIRNNNINIIYNDNFNIFDNNINDNKNKINKNEDIELKKKISKIKIISESINFDVNSINVKDSINENNCSNLINKIKKLFSKERKVNNHKINQTFCCSPINLLDEID